MGDLLTLPVAPRQRLREVHSYGYAAGLVLVLVVDASPANDLPAHLNLVGPEPFGRETVARFEYTAAGRRLADQVANTVLVSLQFAEWILPRSIV